MNRKTDKHFLFETNLAWLTDKKGVLSAHDAEGNLYIETPPAFGGQGKPWTPEHLFLGSVSTCFMTTFLAFAAKMRFNINAMKCPAIGQIYLANGHYQFTQVDLYPEVYVDEKNYDIASKALEKASQHCLVSHSLAIPVFYHSVLKTGSVEVEPEKWLSLPLVGKNQHIIV